ncbi:MAG: hypothetical protein MR601_07185 [Erysipelotrichaceae bacterium]|nr:hypothetical protein [Erysipelotrichaceae bacterium]
MFKYSIAILTWLLFLTFKNYGAILSSKVKNNKIAIGIRIAYSSLIILVGIYMIRLNEFKEVFIKFKKYNEDIMTIILSIYFMFALVLSVQAGNIMDIIKKQFIKNNIFRDYEDFVLFLIVIFLAIFICWLGIRI